MKKLSLLLLMLCVGFTVLAGGPSRAGYPEGYSYLIYGRTIFGSAVNPITHTTYVPQDGLFEIVQYNDSSGIIINGVTSIYIKNIVYGADQELGDYWVKGVRVSRYDGSEEILVQLPQPLLTMDSDGNFTTKRGRKAVLMWGSVHYNSFTNAASFECNTQTTQATYSSIDGNTIYIENTSGPVAIEAQDDVSYDATGLGIAWEDEEEGEGGQKGAKTYEWAGYCEWGTELGTYPYVIDWQPEGELKTYNRTSNSFTLNTATKATVTNEQISCESQIVFGTDGKTVYFKDPIQAMGYDTWVMGTLNENGTIITVPMQQYLRIYYDVDKAVKIEMCNADGSATSSSYSASSLYAEYQVEGNTISLKNTWSNSTDSEYAGNGLHCYDPVAKKEVLETEIVYTLENPGEPTIKTGAPVFNGYTEDGIHAYILEILPTEPSTIYYRIQYPDGEFSEWAEYTEPLSFTGDGKYRVEAYALAPGKLPSEQIAYEFVVAPMTGISEMAGDKQVADKRYYNVMGQQIDQPDGVTIVVTTYTDGTTTAVKVVK